jgi:hypothetical protein
VHLREHVGTLEELGFRRSRHQTGQGMKPAIEPVIRMNPTSRLARNIPALLLSEPVHFVNHE